MILSSLKTRLIVVNVIILIMTLVFVLFIVNYFQKQNAFKEAEVKSTILLKHNLAIHSYINTKLKPTLFALTDTTRDSEFFDPIWMSSTYAVRDIDKLYRQNNEGGYYYKEAAINARSRENEADDFERDFIQKMNKDKNVNKISGVRDYDGKPYFFTMIRGESMEKGCMRCHSTPDKAPTNLVKTYGDTRSFNRSVDEAVSAISIRMPLELPYREANVLSAELSGMIIALLLVTFSLQLRFINQLVLTPLKRFKAEAESITSNPANLGLKIPPFDSKEMDEIATSFNKMSGKLRDVVDSLDIKVQERTADLAESEERFKSMFRNHSAVMLLIEPESGVIVDANQAAEKFYGYSRDKLLTFNISHINNLAPDSVAKERNAAAEKKRNYFVFPHRLSSGEIRTIEVHSTPIMVNNSSLLFSIIHDITDRIKAEEEKYFLEQQFQQTQKLESLGVLSGGIAHDFNNILAIIMGYCDLTKMDYESAVENIPEIEKAAARAAALCRQMLAYSGKATLIQSQVNTLVLVNEMIAMLKTTIQHNVVIKPELGADIPFIMGDASQLRQVVMNIIINAAEAIGDAEGEIGVKLAKAEIRAEQPEQDHLGFIILAGHYICFEVTDTGCGMDDDTRHKIFEPFYTTKFVGRGLGMSAVLGIIKAHNGALQLESRLGHGTTFRVYLPVSLSKPETEEAQQITTSAAWHGSGTVLLAEDEVQFKTILTAMLQDLGFKVLDAANGKEALELYQQNAADITLVVTDMGMPVMNGYELFYKLKQLDPKLPIIISSGFGEGDITSKIPSEAIAGLINKPYSFDQLRDVLKGVVGG